MDSNYGILSTRDGCRILNNSNSLSAKRLSFQINMVDKVDNLMVSWAFNCGVSRK